MLDIIPYLDPNTADDYFLSLMPEKAESWTEATYDQQNAALKAATRIINRLNFVGKKVNTNEWPRIIKFQVIMPDDILIACCEIALKLLDGVNPEQEIRNLAVSNQGYASVSTGYKPNVVLDHVRAGVPSVEAWELLKPYLIDPNEIQLRREDRQNAC